MLLHLKRAWSSSLSLATRCAPTLGQRSLTTVQVSMEKIKQSFTEDAFFRQLERERLEKVKLSKPQINENAPNLMKILEDGDARDAQDAAPPVEARRRASWHSIPAVNACERCASPAASPAPCAKE